MKAKNNTLKTILAVLVIILISLISFIGIFKKDKNKMVNILPDYKLGMEFTGGRTISLKPSESNNKEDLTDKNYEKAKDILIERLKKLNIGEYEVRKNSSTGEIAITIPENNYTDKIISDIYQGGDLKVVDSEEANVSSIVTRDTLTNIDDKLKEKNIENYEVMIAKKEEKVEATENTPESTQIKYEVNIVLPEGTEVKKEDLESSSYNIITTKEVNNDSIILSNEKINQIKDEASKANINNYSIKVKDDKAYILNSSENKVDKIAELEVKNETLLGKKYIKDVQVAYGTQATGTAVVVNIYYNKEGTKILNELSKTYTSKEETSTEEKNEDVSSEQNTKDQSEKNEETEPSKTVDLTLDGSKLISTDFDEEIKDGKLQLSMGQASSSASELSEYLMQASNFAVILKTDTIPVDYEMDTNLFTKSDITNDMLSNLIMFSSIICAVLVIYIIVKYKKSGFLAVISIIGYIATLLLVVRCISNITITITGITAIIISIVMNAIYNISIFKSNGKNTFKKVSCKFLEIYLPCLAIAVVFAFNKYLHIASFGGIMFWSLLTMVIYNLLITNLLLKNSEDK